MEAFLKNTLATCANENGPTEAGPTSSTTPAPVQSADVPSTSQLQPRVQPKPQKERIVVVTSVTKITADEDDVDGEQKVTFREGEKTSWAFYDQPEELEVNGAYSVVIKTERNNFMMVNRIVEAKKSTIVENRYVSPFVEKIAMGNLLGRVVHFTYSGRDKTFMMLLEVLTLDVNVCTVEVRVQREFESEHNLMQVVHDRAKSRLNWTVLYDVRVNSRSYRFERIDETRNLTTVYMLSTSNIKFYDTLNDLLEANTCTLSSKEQTLLTKATFTPLKFHSLTRGYDLHIFNVKQVKVFLTEEGGIMRGICSFPYAKRQWSLSIYNNEKNPNVFKNYIERLSDYTSTENSYFNVYFNDTGSSYTFIAISGRYESSEESFCTVMNPPPEERKVAVKRPIVDDNCSPSSTKKFKF
ncbi:CUN057 hypothetical protein [Culex nigripalpus nucleopolyhedrovirus]|uniref:Uncharacterized protein n=1 Tax=Culex nigripalpus nucleopolyhedrovirus (isolate Florida/1997) TaxID=645993 RepID=Q919L9_NPVCO|nr:CUN057 hypothetical protein [Culex nigripalpus nucleopolyhedrovirus]AAK94135.1 CUN057 hypothetical protein [Culex nigripalpus nucleopolyhedrovirus]